jgi:hypothetical protein
MGVNVTYLGVPYTSLHLFNSKLQKVSVVHEPVVFNWFSELESSLVTSLIMYSFVTSNIVKFVLETLFTVVQTF